MNEKHRNEIYCKAFNTKHGIVFDLNYNHSLYHELHILPNRGVTYDEIARAIKSSFAVAKIGEETHPAYGNDKTIFLTLAGKKFSKGFYLVVSKKFVMLNKKNFLGLLANLLSKKKIISVRGGLSYNLKGKHYFINLNFALSSDIIPYMQQICRNFSNINCIFKYARKAYVILFCETITDLYPVDRSAANFRPYSLSVCANGQEYLQLDFDVFVNNAGNAFIHSSPLKTFVLTREIYAKTLNAAFDILRAEMKNLGLDIKVAEKRRIR